MRVQSGPTWRRPAYFTGKQPKLEEWRDPKAEEGDPRPAIQNRVPLPGVTAANSKDFEGSMELTAIR